MSRERYFRRSKDGIRWTEITYMRMKLDAWKLHQPALALQLIYQVNSGIDTTFANGYIYGRVMPKQEALK